MSGCFPGISQSRISHWLLQHGSDLSEQKKRAFYRWYTLEKTTPGTPEAFNSWLCAFWSSLFCIAYWRAAVKNGGKSWKGREGSLFYNGEARSSCQERGKNEMCRINTLNLDVYSCKAVVDLNKLRNFKLGCKDSRRVWVIDRSRAAAPKKASTVGKLSAASSFLLNC